MEEREDGRDDRTELRDLIDGLPQASRVGLPVQRLLEEAGQEKLVLATRGRAGRREDLAVATGVAPVARGQVAVGLEGDAGASRVDRGSVVGAPPCCW